MHIPPPETIQRHGGKSVVLIVEDDTLTARAVSRLVQSLGFEPRVASRARDALDALNRADELRALVVDLRLPDGSGFWVAEDARRRASTLPIVILTGQMSTASVNQSFRLGAQYLCKPLAPDDVASLRLFLLGAPPQPVVDRLERWARDKTLAPRQTEILTLSLAGLDRSAIADRLCTTVEAIDEHIAGLLETLDAQDLAEVLRLLRRITDSERVARG